MFLVGFLEELIFRGLLFNTMKKDSLKAIFRSSLFWPIILVMGYIGVALTLGIGSGGILGYIGGIAVTAEVLYLFIN